MLGVLIGIYILFLKFWVINQVDDWVFWILAFTGGATLSRFDKITKA
jgi:hypothetical protein